MKLSVLDVLPVASGAPPGDALLAARDLATLADRLGYERVWYAEHHGMANIASAVPELLIAHCAAATERIRVGAGGVMLPNHVPMRVVEQYRTLNALHPGRIDLGIGRAAGTDPNTARALRSGSGGAFGSQLAELLAFAQRTFPADHPYAGIRVTPRDVPLPPIWMLGSSGGSARLAGSTGLGYGFAGHFSPSPAAPSIQAYRASFQPSEAFAEPHVILAMTVVCAPTHEEAVELSSTLEMVFLNMALGQEGPTLSPAEARAAGWRPGISAVSPLGRLMIVGDPEGVRARMEAAMDAAGADEAMVMSITHDPAARLRCYELLAEVFGLA